MAPRPNSIAAIDSAYHLHPNTNARKLEAEGPLVLDRGRGIYVYDDDGKEYIEGLAGLWCTALGFGEERLVEAAAEQMRKLPYYHSFAQKVATPTALLAEKLIGMAPEPMARAFFANSGSEANDTIVKLVWYYNNALGRPEKKKIISRVRAYHGITVAAGSLTGVPLYHRDFDLPLPGFLHTGCPHHYRYARDDESEEAFATRLAEELDQLIQSEGPETVAAFIGEPVMGAGGVIVPPATYWDKIQPVLRKHDVLLIADEVICGFGRTGKMFACETYGIRPDMVTVAKALSSAYLPISGVLMSDQVYQAIADDTDKIGSFGHGFTYSGHPVSAAVALETLKIYEERDIVAHVERIAPRMQEGLRALGEHPLVGEARGVGLIGALELVADKQTKAAFDPLGQVGGYFAKRAEANGLIIRNLQDTIGVCPPLVIAEPELAALLQRLEAALEETWAWVGEQGLASAA